jgi:glycine cleavage system H protein
LAASDAIPEGLLYHPEHDWARIEGDSATLGITDHAQDLLGEIVFWDTPQVGATVTAGESYTELESTKAVSDVIAPLSGEITEVNNAIADTLEKINDDAYGDGWLVRIKVSDTGEADALLSAADYAEAIRE